MLRNITIFDAQEIQSISNSELGYDVNLDIVKKQIRKLPYLSLAIIQTHVIRSYWSWCIVEGSGSTQILPTDEIVDHLQSDAGTIPR